jgi:hypothetical protein
VTKPEPPWCVVGNVRPEAYGNAASPGTRHFRAGALLWIASGHWSDRVTVFGRHRGSLRWIEIVEERARLVNFRVKQAFHPWVANRLPRFPVITEAQCILVAERLNAHHAPIADLADEIARHREAFSLLETDARGRSLYAQAMFALAAWTQQQRQASKTPPHEAHVLADWLEERGVSIPLDELVRTLDRRRAP